jgi:hypothetical protein
MPTDFLDTQLMAYLSLREALGFQMHAEKRILPEFVAYVQAQQHSSPIRAQMARAWACQACSPPHDGHNPCSAPPPRSRLCWRGLKRVVHVEPCALTPYPVCLGCW